MEQQFFTIAEAAEMLRVSTKTVARWIASGKLEAVKPGRDWRIPAAEIKRLTSP